MLKDNHVFVLRNTEDIWSESFGRKRKSSCFCSEVLLLADGRSNLSFFSRGIPTLNFLIKFVSYLGSILYTLTFLYILYSYNATLESLHPGMRCEARNGVRRQIALFELHSIRYSCWQIPLKSIYYITICAGLAQCETTTEHILSRKTYIRIPHTIRINTYNKCAIAVLAQHARQIDKYSLWTFYKR